MRDFHVTANFFAALARGDLARSQAIGWLADHTLALCPVCQREREAFTLECTLGPSGQLAVAEPVLSWLVTVAPGFEGRKQRAEWSARRDFDELMSLPPEERTGRIERARTRFRHPELVERLLAEAHQRIRASPWEAHELAQLALEVGWQLGAGVPATEAAALRARALVHSGNALRVQGQLAAAEREVAAARELVQKAGVTDLAVIAELDWLEGVLCSALRQLDGAVWLLERAILFFELAGDRHRAAVARLSLGAQHQEHGQPERAAAAIYPILDAIDETAEPLLALSAHHNLTLCLCELGRFLEAREVFVRSAGLYRRFDDFWTRLRRSWAEARIERGLGHGEHALGLLAGVRDGFLEQDVRSDAAIASREIAEVLLEANRNGEALEAARFALDVFAEQGVQLELQRTLDLVERLERRLGLSPGPRPALLPRSVPPAPNGTTRPSDVHVTREMLRAQRSGRLSLDEVSRLYLEHLLSLCPECSADGRDRSVPEPPRPVESHGDALRRLARSVPDLVRRVQHEEEHERQRLAELLALPAARRVHALDSLPGGPLSYALADLLLGSAQEQIARDAWEALARIELVREIVDRMNNLPTRPPRLAVAELRVRGLSLQGEALRQLQRFARAEHAYASARAVTRDEGLIDPGLQADLDAGEAALRRDQGRLPATLRLYRRAFAQYLAIGADDEAARTQIEIAVTQRQAGEPERSLETLQEALARLDPVQPSHRPLAALAHEHAAARAAELGRDAEARRHLEARRALLARPRSAITSTAPDIAAAVLN